MAKGQQKIVVSCDQMGGIKIDAQGFVGQGCKAATKSLEEIFVSQSRAGTTKPEYYQPEPGVGIKQSVGGDRF